MPLSELEFRLEEWKSLRAEIEAELAATRANEREVLIGSALIWAWGATLPGEIRDIVFWVPVGLALLGGVRSWALYRSMSLKGRYIKDVECLLPTSQPHKGWESYRAAELHGSLWKKLGRWSLAPSTVLTWAALLALALFVALTLSNKAHPGTLVSPTPKKASELSEAHPMSVQTQLISIRGCTR